MLEAKTGVVSAKYRRRQDWSGAIFAVIYAINVVPLVLKYFGVIPQDFSWYIFPIGVLAVIAFILLYTIASNSMSEIFAGCQIVMTGFFSLLMPFVVSANGSITMYSITLMYISIMFGIAMIYLWTVLMYNIKFRPDEIRWILFLPMSYIGNICGYYCVVESLDSDPSYIVSWMQGNLVYPPLTWALMVFSAIGYWKLCHSECFSGPTDDISFPKWTPLNRFALAYLIGLVAVYLLY